MAESCNEKDDDEACSSGAQRVLTENDIPGASLNGKNPKDLKIPQLKRWLQCRNASVKGKKAELVARYVSILLSVHFVFTRVS